MVGFTIYVRDAILVNDTDSNLTNATSGNQNSSKNYNEAKDGTVKEVSLNIEAAIDSISVSGVVNIKFNQ